jgi:hypothetical protein
MSEEVVGPARGVFAGSLRIAKTGVMILGESTATPVASLDPSQISRPRTDRQDARSSSFPLIDRFDKSGTIVCSRIDSDAHNNREALAELHCVLPSCKRPAHSCLCQTPLPVGYGISGHHLPHCKTPNIANREQETPPPCECDFEECFQLVSRDAHFEWSKLGRPRREELISKGFQER